MARVTVEDCVVQIPNRFELVMLAAQRSRELSVGADLTVDRDNDKNPVVALREIADETIDLNALEDGLIQSLQKNVDVDEPIDEAEEILAVKEALGGIAALEVGDEAGSDVTGAGFEDLPDVEGGEDAEPVGEPDKD